MHRTRTYLITAIITLAIPFFMFTPPIKIKTRHSATPKAVLVASEKFYFNSFVDCNMAEAWIGDTFRIFPGKYGEDPLWGEAHDLKFADGRNADEVFSRKSVEFTEPVMPKNTLPGTAGLHGAVWFETVYQDA